MKLCGSQYSTERSQGQCKKLSRSGKNDLTNSGNLAELLSGLILENKDMVAVEPKKSKNVQ